MLINDVNISQYKAKLLERNISVASVDNKNVWNTNFLMPVECMYKYSYKVIRLKFDIKADDSSELELIKSKLIKSLEKATIKFDDINYSFIGYYSEIPTIERISKNNDTLELNFYCYMCNAETFIKISDTDNHTINNNGTSITPCYLEIIPTFSYSSLTITGLSDDPIKINNITANKKIIIDGYTNKIAEDGVNKFNDVELFEFPRLTPGNNTIKISDDRATLTVKWKERFI